MNILIVFTQLFFIFILVSCGGGNSSNSSPHATGVTITDDNGGTTILGDTLTASYSFSDPNGDTEGNSTFQWFRNGNPISGATTLNYTITSAELGLTITFEVTPVNATAELTGTPTASNEINVFNTAPVATAELANLSDPTALTIIIGSSVTAFGENSFDPEQNTLTYNWSFASQPANSTATLSSASDINPFFNVDVAGEYIVQLIVNDGIDNSAASVVTVTAITDPNLQPVAIILAENSVVSGTIVDLQGYTSSDPDGDPLTYSWVLSSRPTSSTASLSVTASPNSTITPDIEGTYIIELTVSDGLVNSPVDSHTITVIAASTVVPTSAAGILDDFNNLSTIDTNVSTNYPVYLDGSNSTDPNNNPLTYSWSFSSIPQNSTATLSGASSINPIFTPDVDGTYLLELIVNDNVYTASDLLTVTAYNNIGVRDTTFGPDSQGIVYHDNAAGANGADWGWSVATDNQDNTFVAGWSSNGTNDDMTIWKYNSAGILDTGFNGTGIVTFDSSFSDQGQSIAVDSTGNIFVVGISNNDMALWKYTSSGVLDSTFNSTGFITAGGTGYDIGMALSIDDNGNIYVTGEPRNASDSDMALWKYLPNGTLDTTFNGTGLVIHHDAAGGNSFDHGYAIALDSSNNIFITGASQAADGFYDMTIWKYSPNGSLDTTFNSTGFVTHHNAASGNKSDEGWSILLDSSNNLYIGGNSQGANLQDAIIWKFNNTGALDISFATNGVFVFNGDTSYSDFIYSLQEDTVGNIYAGGYTKYNSSSGRGQVLVIKLDSDGILN